MKMWKYVLLIVGGSPIEYNAAISTLLQLACGTSTPLYIERVWARGPQNVVSITRQVIATDLQPSRLETYISL